MESFAGQLAFMASSAGKAFLLLMEPHRLMFLGLGCIMGLVLGIVPGIGGLAGEDGKLSPLQESFRRHHALQCGYCTAGILMSLAHFLETKSAPTEGELREVIGGHLCRCTGYTQIIAAAVEAAAKAT